MYLIINQAILAYFVALVKKEKIVGYSLKRRRNDILKSINKIFKKNKIKLQNIKGIIIISDQHSFTQLRIAITIANLMGKFLNVPIGFMGIEEIKNKNLGEIIKMAKKEIKRKIILPIYDREPNIMPILSKSVAIGNKIEHPPKSAK